MKSVEVKLKSPDSGDNSVASVLVETNRGSAGWVRESARDVQTNSKEVQTFNLRQGQRLVIETAPVTEMVYDPVQGASVNPRNQRNERGMADTPEPKLSDEDKKHLQQEGARLDKAAKEAGLPVADRAKAGKEAGEAELKRVQADQERDMRPLAQPAVAPVVPRQPVPDEAAGRARVADAELAASTRSPLDTNPAPETSTKAAEPKSGPHQEPKKK